MAPQVPREKTSTLSFADIGRRGLDLWNTPANVSPDSSVAASNVRTDKRDVRRRDGMQVGQALTNIQDTTGAISIADATDYAHALWHAAQEPDVGPWVIFFHFKAVRPAGNPANHSGVCIMLREVADGTHRSSYGFELATNGTFYAHFSRNSDGTKYTLSTVLAADLVVDGFLFWNPSDGATGRLSLYVNDVLVTSVTGPGASAIPLRSAVARLTWGQTSLGAIPANLEADTCFAGGVIDAFTLLSWPGRNASDVRINGRSLIDHCLRFARQSYPNPLESQFHYDFDGNGWDLSWSANHATVVGAPAYVARLASPCSIGQYVGVFDKTDSSKDLIVISGGRLWKQPLKIKK